MTMITKIKLKRKRNPVVSNFPKVDRLKQNMSMKNFLKRLKKKRKQKIKH